MGSLGFPEPAAVRKTPVKPHTPLSLSIILPTPSLFITSPHLPFSSSKPTPLSRTQNRKQNQRGREVFVLLSLFLSNSMDSSSSISSSSSSSSSGSLSAGDLEAGFSGCAMPGAPLPSYASRRRASYRSMRGSPRFFCEPFDDEPHHFLDSCFLCKKPLAGNRDIFMYRGDTPFCSEECRKEQIEIDEAREKNWKLSSSLKASSRKEQQQQQKGGASSPTKSQKIHVRAGTVVAG